LADERVLLITGPAGAGKSSVAQAWAASRSETCAHLQLDDFRQLVVSGYHDPRIGWNEEAQRQLDLARTNVAGVATNFIKSEIDVVIDDVAFPDWEPSGLERWERALEPIEIDLVVLMPNWDIVVERNSVRDSHDQLPGPMLRKIYDDMSGWLDREDVLLIDNSKLSVDETVAEIERMLGLSS